MYNINRGDVMSKKKKKKVNIGLKIIVIIMLLLVVASPIIAILSYALK